ncbi:MAG: hypothetical protein ABFS34_03955 [Gemmatimonadota bacterium]
MIQRRTAAGLVLATLVVACSDDSGGTGPGEVTLADLAATYDVLSFTFTADGNSALSANLIQATNATLTVTLLADGSFSGLLNAPALTETTDDVPIGGTLTLTGDDTASIDFDAATSFFFPDVDISFEFSPPNFVWTATDVTFDFTLERDPNNAIPADLTVVLVQAI